MLKLSEVKQELEDVFGLCMNLPIQEELEPILVKLAVLLDAWDAEGVEVDS